MKARYLSLVNDFRAVKKTLLKKTQNQKKTLNYLRTHIF